LDVRRRHADAAHRFVLADAAGVDRAVDAEAELADRVALYARQANPALADRVVRIIGEEVLARDRVGPAWVFQLAVDRPGAGRGGAVLAEADDKRADVDIAQVDVHAVGRLADDRAERAANHLDPLADLQAVGLAHAVDPAEQLV